MNERQAVTKVFAERYKAANKKQKKVILSEFIDLAGYGRCYASYLLRINGKQVTSSKASPVNGRKVTKRRRAREYDSAVFTDLKKIWAIMDCICGKRLEPMLKEVMPILKTNAEIEISETIRNKLYKISAATIDRLLSQERKEHQIKGKSHTRPGTLLKSEIPIRTFSQWSDKKPGFVEIDLVGHDGGDSYGEFAQTLDITDVSTGWTDMQAVKNR
ncbi:integrase catalytic subunit [Candidatus Magnetobacterium bavaricum]|uniref:Integrase catalytic subunit n=1 Tax=Candidatus Magnetobacterium bavaricum TaxID=29290 RepID=A0A0F3GUY0_9BACT|nr:integrase catalytic subunit [Candidatus Magnetobacterium bavaricum]